MARLSASLAAALWDRAAKQEFGICVTVGDPKTIRELQRILYDTRKKANVPAWNAIMVCIPEGLKEVYLVKKEVELEG